MNTRTKQIIFGALIAIIIAAIPITMYLMNQQQDVRSRAEKSTSVSLTPTMTTTSVGENINLDITLDPGVNQVSFAKLVISFDPAKLTTASGSCGGSFCPTAALQTIEDPSYTQTATIGTVTVALSISGDPTKVVQTPTKIGTITFKAKNTTNNGVTLVSFGDATQILSYRSSDSPSENVLSLTNPASITIASAGITPTETPPSCNEIKLGQCSWDASSDATSYFVTITNLTSGAVVKSNETVQAPNTSITFPATAGSTYKCEVTTQNSCEAKSTPESAIGNCPLPTPTPTSIPTPSPTPLPTSTPQPTSTPKPTTPPLPTIPPAAVVQPTTPPPPPAATVTPVTIVQQVAKPTPTLPPAGDFTTMSIIGIAGIALSTFGVILFFAL